MSFNFTLYKHRAALEDLSRVRQRKEHRASSFHSVHVNAICLSIFYSSNAVDLQITQIG